MPSKQGVWTHDVCSGHLTVPLPTTLLAHTPAGWGHGGTRKSNPARNVHTRSVSPAIIAGVQSRHRVAEPVPLVGSGWVVYTTAADNSLRSISRSL
jgi:hypothetical protein